MALLITQLTNTSHFANDLGLDSLDTVEVVMAIEEVYIQLLRIFEKKIVHRKQEFSIEIPDKDADQIHSSMFAGYTND